MFLRILVRERRHHDCTADCTHTNNTFTQCPKLLETSLKLVYLTTLDGITEDVFYVKEIFGVWLWLSIAHTYIK